MNAEFLKDVELFQGLNDTQLAEILLLGVVKEYSRDDVIFEEHSPGDSFYVIYSGAIRISKIFDQMGEEALTVLRPGDFLGEMSFFQDEPDPPVPWLKRTLNCSRFGTETSRSIWKISLMWRSSSCGPFAVRSHVESGKRTKNSRRSSLSPEYSRQT